jgi:hypothetical protein
LISQNTTRREIIQVFIGRLFTPDTPKFVHPNEFVVGRWYRFVKNEDGKHERGPYWNFNGYMDYVLSDPVKCVQRSRLQGKETHAKLIPKNEEHHKNKADGEGWSWSWGNEELWEDLGERIPEQNPRFKFASEGDAWGFEEAKVPPKKEVPPMGVSPYPIEPGAPSYPMVEHWRGRGHRGRQFTITEGMTATRQGDKGTVVRQRHKSGQWNL